METAVIYARYSSENQTEQSIEGQLRVCNDYARNNDILIVGTYVDRAMTGTNDLRPDFQRMIKDSAKKQWNYILVYKLDRFSRNKYESTIHKHTLKENGVKLLSAMENIPDTPEGIILESLLEGMNQYYSAELSQKVHRGLKESYRKGNNTGGFVTFGYDVVDKKNVINPIESEVVKELFTKTAQGYTIVSIIRELKERGFRMKSGKYLDKSKAYKIITNSKYIGKVTHYGVVYDNIFPRIIDDETWEKVQEIHKQNMHAPATKKNVYEFLLTGKLVCGECGSLMVGESGTSCTGARYQYYACLARRRKKALCDMSSVNKELLEDLVVNTTLQLLSSDEVITKIAKSVYKVHEEANRNDAVLKSLESKRGAAIKASQNLIAAIEQGIITEQTKTRLKELETQISQYDFDIDQEKRRTYVTLTIDKIKAYLKMMIKSEVKDARSRKLLINSFIREIVLCKDKVIITYRFDDDLKPHSITKKNTLAIISEADEKKSAFITNFSSSISIPAQPNKKNRLLPVLFVLLAKRLKRDLN